MEEVEKFKIEVDRLREQVSSLTDAPEALNDIYLRMVNEDDTDLWVEPKDIAALSGTTTNEVNQIVYNFNDFVVNSKGKITSRQKYNAKTPFLNKLRDASTGLIK
jgi:glutathione peroxidase-family protein